MLIRNCLYLENRKEIKVIQKVQFDKTVVTVISSPSCRVVLSGAAVLCLQAAAAPSDSLPALPPPENYYLSDSLTPGRQSVCLSR